MRKKQEQQQQQQQNPTQCHVLSLFLCSFFCFTKVSIDETTGFYYHSFRWYSFVWEIKTEMILDFIYNVHTYQTFLFVCHDLFFFFLLLYSVLFVVVIRIVHTHTHPGKKRKHSRCNSSSSRSCVNNNNNNNDKK